ncbi:HAD family hydrolase [Tessaracoccus terricola]
MSSKHTPAAVLWDFDGTLADTETVWSQVQQELLATYGLYWDDEKMNSLIGIGAMTTAELVAEALGDADKAIHFYDRAEEGVVARIREGISWLPGAHDLLEQIDAAGVPSAIVTASSRRVMAPVMEHLPPTVSFVVTSDDVENSKPDPEGYLQAMARLGVEPADVIVLEDSVPGSQAALAAGAVVYAVPALAQLEPHPRMQVSTTGLRSTTWDDLVAVWNERSR